MGRTVFDRAAHHRRDQPWLDEAWTSARVLLRQRGIDHAGLSGRRPPSGSRWPNRPTSARPASAGSSACTTSVAYFAVRSEAAGDWRGLRDIGDRGDPLELDLLVTAVALTQWHLRHGRCALCGAATEIEQAGWTRRCPVDGSEHFPRTDPAVIMLIHDGGDRCLLGRGAIWAPGRYSTLAGFVEPGESLESAVIREVFEEVGVAVDDVRYVASQPWPFPSSLMLGFIAHADGAAVVRPDKVEMAEAAGSPASRSPRRPTGPTQAAPVGHRGAVRCTRFRRRLSISRFLIDIWLAGRARTAR